MQLLKSFETLNSEATAPRGSRQLHRGMFSPANCIANHYSQPSKLGNSSGQAIEL
jgi:hypothetical protein